MQDDDDDDDNGLFFSNIAKAVCQRLRYTIEEVSRLLRPGNEALAEEVAGMLNELPSASDALAGDGSDPDHDSEGSDAESDDGIGDDSEDEEEPEMAANMDALSLLELRQCCDQKCLEKLASDPLTKNSFKMSVECLKKLLSLQGYSRHVALLAFRSKFVAVTNRWPQNPSEHFLPRGLNYFYDSERKICRSAYAALLGCSAFRLTRIIKYVKEFKISNLQTLSSASDVRRDEAGEIGLPLQRDCAVSRVFRRSS